MKATLEIRTYFGLSQELMAQYLGVSLGQLAMCEIGKRELPINALKQLAQMTVFAFKNTPFELDPNLFEKVEAEAKIILNKKYKKLHFKLVKEQRLLSKLEKKKEQNYNLMAYGLALQSTNSDLAATVVQEAKSRLTIENNVQLHLQKLKVITIESQLEFLNSL